MARAAKNAATVRRLEELEEKKEGILRMPASVGGLSVINNTPGSTRRLGVLSQVSKRTFIPLNSRE
jgi:hypothetical protein